MILNPGKQQTRKAAAMVEMASVAIVFFLFLFGIVEYCRYMFYLQVLDNAAREGVRYAVVNTMKDDLVDKTKEIIDKKMVGVDNVLSDYKISIFRSDTKGGQVGSPNGAEFGEFIVVQLEGDYSPILPSFLFLDSKIKMRTKALMNSEAN